MTSSLNRGVRVALSRPRVLGVVAVAVVAETCLRLALAAVHPVFALLCPPVVAVPLLGAAAPAVSAAVDDPGASPNRRLRASLRERGPRLLAAAVAGHLVAVGVGTAGFLVVDTAVRAAFYAAGGVVPTAVVYVTPLVGVAAATLVAWGPLAPAVARVVAGDPAREAVVAPLRALRDRRRTALVVGLHAACALVVAGAFLTGFVYAMRRGAVGGVAGIPALVAVAAVLLCAFGYPIHVALERGRARSARGVRVRRVALAALLVAGLTVGAGAVRVTEARPTPDAGTAPLPADASDAYAAALDRTAAADHRVVARERGRERTVGLAWTLERSARRYRTVSRFGDAGEPSVGYADSGVAYGLSGVSPGLFALGTRDGGEGRSARALPGYWPVVDDYRITDMVGFGLPRAGTGAWETVERGNGTRTLELAGGDAVFDALQRGRPANATYETARIRMRVDADRGVVTGGRARLNASLPSGRYVRNVTYDVRSGGAVDARRPAALGRRALGEWVWDAFAY